MKKNVTPYNKVKSKKSQIAHMFNNISKNYDFLNHFLSFGIDIIWRKKAIIAIKNNHPKIILDIATGTGDLAIEACKLNPNKIIGVDISKGMLEVGRHKVKKKKLDHIIELKYGDSEKLDLKDESIDAITAGFGVRNFENLNDGLSEMFRVLKKGGITAILEPTEPTSFPFKQLYNFYFKNILPTIGKIISKDNFAYRYLPNSVESFPSGEQFLSKLKKVGFKKPQHIKLTFGIAALYIAKK